MVLPLPQEQKTWTHFKTHFLQAHQELKEAGDLQVQDSQFNLANTGQEVIDGVQSVLQPQDQTIEATN